MSTADSIELEAWRYMYMYNMYIHVIIHILVTLSIHNEGLTCTLYICTFVCGYMYMLCLCVRVGHLGVGRVG